MRSSLSAPCCSWAHALPDVAKRPHQECYSESSSSYPCCHWLDACRTRHNFRRSVGPCEFIPVQSGKHTVTLQCVNVYISLDADTSKSLSVYLCSPNLSACLLAFVLCSCRRNRHRLASARLLSLPLRLTQTRNRGTYRRSRLQFCASSPTTLRNITLKVAVGGSSLQAASCKPL